MQTETLMCLISIKKVLALQAGEAEFESPGIMSKAGYSGMYLSSQYHMYHMSCILVIVTKGN